jgi:hypothetical protein
MTVVVPGPGDIGLVRMRGAEGRLVRVGQWLAGGGYADFEHAFVYLGGGELVEAEPKGARISALGEYVPASIVWLRCPDQYREAVAAAARGMVGVPYSWLDYFAIAAHRFRLPVPGLRGYINATGHEMCSQLADRAALLAGWHLFADGRWQGYVKPVDLYELAMAKMKKGFA